MQEPNVRLTQKQREIYEHISQYYNQNNFSPTLKEIGETFGFGISGAQSFVKVLMEKHYLYKSPNSPRSLVPKNESLYNMSVSLPLLGTISAGYGIQIDETSEPEKIEVPTSMARSGRDYYCLRVVGWSMKDSNIADGDIIVIKHQATADNGEIVVAILKGEFDEKATLKKFYHRGKYIELIPQNPEFEKITVPLDKIEIRGKFCGLIRRVESESIHIKL